MVSGQTRFVDAPAAAVSEADSLVTRTIHERGYPIDAFHHQAAIVSVDHPAVVDNYRHGHQVYVASVTGSAATEDMRRGFVAYRELFAELHGEDQDAGATANQPPARGASARLPVVRTDAGRAPPPHFCRRLFGDGSAGWRPPHRRRTVATSASLTISMTVATRQPGPTTISIGCFVACSKSTARPALSM